MTERDRSEAAGGGGSLPGQTLLRYLAATPITVHGPVSGRLYAFAGQGAQQLVDTRDVSALLATRYFARQY